MHSWLKTAQTDMCPLQCRRLSPSCNNQRVLITSRAFGDDAGVRRWQAKVWKDLWDLKPAIQSRMLRESECIPHRARPRSGRVQNLLGQSHLPNPHLLTLLRSYPCDLGFRDKEYASRHRTLQIAVHVCDAFQNKKPSCCLSDFVWELALQLYQ